MPLPAPWGTPPGRWSLNGHPFTVVCPATTDLALALVVPDKEGGGLWTTLECTAPAQRSIVAELVLTDPPRRGLDLFGDIADALVHNLIGWKRWEAAYLWQQTLSMWPAIDGEHLGRGVDLAALPAGRATNAVYAWWRRALSSDEDAWKTFEKDMKREPRRVIRREAAKPLGADVAAQLQAVAAAAGAGPVSNGAGVPDQHT